MENPLKNKYDIGVVIGRFQVPGLTDGHKHIIDNVLESHKQIVVIIGISPTLGTKKNPLGYTARMQMIQDVYPKAIVLPHMDVGFDETWSKQLDTLIRSVCPVGSVCLYGGRDSFIKRYYGIYPTFEIGITDEKEGTRIREEIGKEVINSYDFRSGAIYQTQNMYPKVFPTVDIAVIKRENKEIRVLMGKRHGDMQWRFPGGFVDPTDINLEDAALRELGEEVDVDIDPQGIKYLGSCQIEDWRYTNADERILTSFFMLEYISGCGRTNSDEFVETDWVLVSDWVSAQDIVYKSHLPLFEILLNYFKKGKKNG